MLPDGTAFQFIPALLGTNATMFFSTAVEDSCLWMTAVIRGKDCSVEPAMRPREFTVLLDKILSEMQFTNTTAGEHNASAGQKTKQSTEERLSPGRLRWSFSPWIQNKESYFMRRREKPNPLPYFLIPARANNEANSRRWNQVLISILGILVIGIFLVALVPKGEISSSAATGNHVLLERAYVPITDESSVILHDVKVENLTPAVAHHLGISTKTGGIVVASVDPSSPPEIASLESGDVIEQVNHSAVSDVEQFDRALASSHDEPVSLLIKRGEDTKVVVLNEAH
jgi:hypothetical protein